MRKTKEEHEITKKLLLEVAGYLFEKEGYYHTSLESIAAGAWVTRWAIYWNFSGKIEMLEKLLDQNYKKYSMMLELDFEKITSVRQKFYSMIEIYFQLLKNDESFRQVERLHYFEKFTGEEKILLEKYSKNDISGFEKYAAEIYSQWILRLEFQNRFLPELFSQSFVSFFLWIIISFLPENNFDENLEKAKKRLDVFLQWVQ